MRKTKVVLASILKPVDETRMYEKIGLSLDQTNKYEINIIGFSTKNTAKPENIKWHSLGNYGRWEFKRLLAPWKCLNIIIKAKPKVIVFNTPELLIVMIIYKILFGGKLIYDVLENYRKNVLHTNAFVSFFRPVIAYTIRSMERLSRPFINHYFLAEKSYESELGFARKKHTIIENKFKPLAPIVEKRHKTEDNIKLLYTGTIALNYGIFDAINLADQLYEVDKRIMLTIIGFCAQESLLLKLKANIANKSYIRLTGGEKPVPHPEIIAAIESADLALCPYHENPSTDYCFPTKIYEYMAHRIPIAIRNNPYWTSFCQQHQACIITDFQHPNVTDILNTLAENKFYSNTSEMDIFWDSEAIKLLTVMEKISQPQVN